jgi:hypothetical protein
VAGDQTENWRLILKAARLPLSLVTPLFFFLRQHRDARRRGDGPAVWK